MPIPEIDPGIMRRRVARMGRLADVRLRGVASQLERQDAELSHRIRDLAACDLLGEITKEIRASVASVGDRINELTGAALFDGEMFAAGMDTGDFYPFVKQLAERFEVFPPAVNALWHGRDLPAADLEALTALAAAADAADPTTWLATLVSMISLVNDLIAIFVDTTQEHTYSCGSVEVTTLSLLEADFSGLESDENKQPFSAKYVVQFEGDVSEACITFNLRFGGSRLDKIDYPMSARATMANGSTLALTPELVADSDYNEMHKVAIFANARTVEISVNGTAHWDDWVGYLAGIGSVPHGTVCVSGKEHRFGGEDGIWIYGWSK